ncbi:MAG: ABC transporter permease, partial [Vicinamibacterales bacterium]
LLLTPTLATILVRWLPSDLGPVFLDVSVDWRLLAGALVLMGALTLLITLAAIAYVTRQGPAPRLIATAPGVTARVRIGAQRALVIVQVGVSVVVLSAAVLFVQTLRNLGRVDLGYSQEHVLVASIDPRSVGYEDGKLQHLYRTVQERLTAVPEISSASLIVGRPFLLRRGSDVEVVGQRVDVRWEVVGPQYFATLGMDFESGRDFTHGDTAAAPQVVIVNRRFANEYFRGRNPVGDYVYRIKTENGRTLRVPMEVVGLVRDVIHRNPRDEARPVLYAPIAQETFALSPAAVVARSRVAARQLEAAVRAAVAETDKNLALFDVKTFEQQIDETIWAERLLARVSTGFGVTALLLVGLGLFGTLSQAVTRRAKEIALRIAVGADAGRIQRGIVSDGLVLYAAGALVGVPLAVAATRYFRSLLFGIEPVDWRVPVVVGLLLGTTAALAAYLPARRASKVDPMQVLRTE